MMNTREAFEKQATSLFDLPLQIIPALDLIEMPGLHQQYGSLTALEKFQLGILLSAACPKVVVETGVWRGRTTRFISEYMAMNQIDGVVYGFDLPEIIDELQAGDPFFNAVSNIEFVRGSLPTSLNQWLSRSDRMIDLALVDANHTFYSVYKELALIAPRLTSNGYILCHDYADQGSKYEGVMCAVNEIGKKYGLAVLPFWSLPGTNPQISCQAAILHKKVHCSYKRRAYHWRKYYAQEWTTLGAFWGRIRAVIEKISS